MCSRALHDAIGLGSKLCKKDQLIEDGAPIVKPGELDEYAEVVVPRKFASGEDIK